MPHTKKAFDLMESLSAKVAETHPKSVLYVGWRHDCKPWWFEKFSKEDLKAEKVGVVEIFQKNLSDLEDWIWMGDREILPILGDIREADKLIQKKEWDVIFWDHGPEHVTCEDLINTTTKLYNLAGQWVIYCCPWGEWPQGEEDGNQFEIHRNYITEDMLKQLGMEVYSVGVSGVEGEGELIGLKNVII